MGDLKAVLRGIIDDVDGAVGASVVDLTTGYYLAQHIEYLISLNLTSMPSQHLLSICFVEKQSEQ